jgi:hypothetical protein
MSVRFTALAPVRCELLVAGGGQRIAAAKRDNHRSKQIKENPMPSWLSDNQASAIENGAAVSICVRRVNGPDPSLPRSMP